MLNLNKIIIFIYLTIIITSIELSEYEKDSINNLPKHGNKITITTSNNIPKCIAKTNIKENETIFIFKKDEILSSETCYYPNKEQLIKNISSIFQEEILFREQFILSSCLLYIIDNYYNKEKLLNINNNIIELVKKLPIKNYEKAQFSLTDEEMNEYLITARNYYYEQDYNATLIGEKIFIDYNTNNTKKLLFGSLYYYIEQRSFFINNKIILIPYYDICNIFPYYLTKENNNYINLTNIIVNDDKYILNIKRSFKQNEHFLFGYNHTYDNEEMLSKNGIFFRDNIYDTHKIIKKYYYELNYKSDGILHYLRKRNLDPRLLNYAQEENGHELFVEFNITSESINPIIFKYALIYYTWDKMEKNQQNISYRHIGKQTFLFILQLIYDELKEIEDKSEVNFFDYLLATQKEKNKRMKIIKEFNLETCNLLFKNINYLYPDLINISWKDIEQFKDRYIIIDPNTLVDRK
jgi:hypothetical protein